MTIRYYRQCSLRKGNVQQISYIPEKFAIVGKILKLKQDDDTWEDGWEVRSAGELKEHTYLETMDNIWRPSSVLTQRGKK